MEKQDLDPKKPHYFVRFAWYQHRDLFKPEEAPKRFEMEPVQPFQYVGNDYDQPYDLYPEIDHEEGLNLFRCRHFVNDFMNCALPTKLLKANHLELIKFMVMTDEISIDEEGQLSVSLHPGELFIEIVEIYDEENMVKRVLARWHVLAKSVNEKFFPDHEMLENHSFNKEKERQKQDNEEVTPFIDSTRLRVEIVKLLMVNNPDLTFDAEHFRVFGYINASGVVMATMVATPESPVMGTQDIMFGVPDSTKTMVEWTTLGKPVKYKEIRSYFENHKTDCMDRFLSWFSENN